MKAALLLATFVVLSLAQPSTVGYQIAQPTSLTVLATSNASTLFQINVTENAEYEYPVLLIDLHGSRWQQGYDYGYLLADRILETQTLFLASALPNEFDQELLFTFAQWQWDGWLSQEVPDVYLEELLGIRAGGEAKGVEGLDEVITRFILLANLPGDYDDFVYVILSEVLESGTLTQQEQVKLVEMFQKIQNSTFGKTWKGTSCSMFGVWGSRTQNGDLYSARNLDWLQDTGITKNKLVTVWHPPNANAHASFGFAGLYGALAGVSEKGLSVHEANLEESRATFEGFPWILRLRYIMEYASNITEAKLLWEETNNTVGFNHMVASAAEPMAVAMETLADYTAYFFPMDPREQNATYFNAGTNQTIQLGYPLPEAVYRTNHPFDPIARETLLWSQSPGTNPESSENRYLLIYKGFSHYQQIGVPITYIEAINVTAIAASKGPTVYQCPNTPSSGSNILSVTFQPGANMVWAAWEDGTGNTWRPACCSTYVELNMTKWW